MFAGSRAPVIRVLLFSLLIAASPAARLLPQSFQAQQNSSTQKAQLAANYGKLPLSFEANAGQTDGRVKFLSRGSGYGLYLTGAEAVLQLNGHPCKSGTSAQPSQAGCGNDAAVVTMRLAGGANQTAKLVGEEP